MAYLMSHGLTRAQASGVVGNLVWESGNYLDPRVSGGGIGQWAGSRYSDMVRFEGGKPDFRKQVEFVWHELTTNGSYGLAQLRRATTPAQAAAIVMNLYEKPNPKLAHLEHRIRDAEFVYHGEYGHPG